jgi:hypothetical protein
VNWLSSLRSTTAKRPPSDFELLKAIYEYHRGDYTTSRLDRPTGTGVMIPIDIPAIAATLNTDEDTVFGRLYHHLDRVYGEQERDDGRGRRALLTPLAGNEPNCINFPLLEAVLAALWQERDRQLWAVRTSLISIAIALAALIVSIVVAIVTTA